MAGSTSPAVVLVGARIGSADDGSLGGKTLVGFTPGAVDLAGGGLGGASDGMTAFTPSALAGVELATTGDSRVDGLTSELRVTAETITGMAPVAEGLVGAGLGGFTTSA